MKMLTFLMVSKTIPNKRLISTLIAVILASAIFAGTLMVVFSLDQQTSSFFDNRDNSVVIFDPTVNTPFTSRISSLITESIDVLPGVLAYSEEIIQPAIIQNEPSFYRGVNLQHLIKFDPSIKIIGNKSSIPEIPSTGTLIGMKLAERLKISVGDLITISSTIKGRSLELRVLAIVESDQTYQFEALVALETAQFLADYVNQYTHIQVLYDPTITSSAALNSLLTTKHELKINTFLDNGTASYSGLTVNLLQDGKTKLSVNANESLSVFLETGYYMVELADGRTVLDRKEVILTHAQEVELHSNQFNYTAEFHFTFENRNISKIPYSLLDQNLKPILSGETNTSNVTFELPSGKYSLKVDISDRPFFYNFTLDAPCNKEFDLTTSLVPPVFNIENQTIFLTNSFYIPIANLSPYFTLNLFDLDSGKSLTNFSRGNQFVTLSLSSGSYKMDILNSFVEPNEKVASLLFTVNSSLSPIVSTDLVNYAHYSPNETIAVSLNGIDPETIQITMNNQTLPFSVLGQNNIIFNMSSMKGVYFLTIEGKDYNLRKYTKQWFVIVDSSSLGGWALGFQNPIVTVGSKVPVWFKGEFISIPAEWSFQAGPVIGNGMLTLNGVPASNSTVLTTTAGSILLNYSYIASFSNLLSITNSSRNEHHLSSNTTYISSDISFTFDPNVLLVNWEINGTVYDIIPNLLYSVPNGSLNSTLRITTKSYESPFVNYSLTIFDSANLTDVPSPLEHISNQSRTGLLRIVFPGYRYEISWLNGSSFVPSMFNETHAVLPPGEFNLTIIELSFNTSRSITIKVPKFNSNFQWNFNQSATVLFDWGFLSFLSNETISLTEGVFRSDELPSVIFNDPYVDEFPKILPYVTTGSTFSEILSNFRYLEYRLVFPNGTEVTKIYNSNFTVQSFVNEQIVIHFLGLNKYEMTINQVTNVILNQPVASYRFSIQMRSNETFTYSGLDVTLSYTNSDPISLKVTNPTETFEIMDYEFAIKNVRYNGFPFFYTYEIDSTSKKVNLYLGMPAVEITLFNKNTNETEVYSGVLVIKDLSGNNEETLIISPLQKITLAPGEYLFSMNWLNQSLTFRAEIDFSKRLAFSLPLINRTLFFEFTKIGDFFISNVRVTHLLGEFSADAIVIQSTNTFEQWRLDQFPFGEVTVQISMSNGKEINITRPIQSNMRTLNFLLDFSGLKTNYVDQDLLNKRSLNRGIGLASSSNYVEGFLGNFITLVRLVFLAEIIAISAILILNIFKAVEFFTALSRHEIRILRSIGFSNLVAQMTISRALILFSPIASFIGYEVAYQVLSLYIKANGISLFGRDLFFAHIDPLIIMLNFGAVLLMVFSTVLFESRKLEFEEI